MLNIKSRLNHKNIEKETYKKCIHAYLEKEVPQICRENMQEKKLVYLHMKISVDHHNKVQRGKRAKKDACTTFREKVAPRQYTVHRRMHRR